MPAHLPTMHHGLLPTRTSHKTHPLWRMLTAIAFVPLLWGTTPMPVAASGIIATHPQPSAPSPLPSRDQEIPIPADGNCLYNSLVMDYLVPVTEDEKLFNRRLAMLVGEDIVMQTEETKDNQDHDNNNEKKVDLDSFWNPSTLRQSFLKLRRAGLVYALRHDPFIPLVRDMKKHMHIGHGLWGGKDEIKKIAQQLQVNIQEYTPHPKDHTQLVAFNTTHPQGLKVPLTLRIVKDKATKEEAYNPDDDPTLRKVKVLSLQDDKHRQHYRALLDVVPDFLQKKALHTSSAPSASHPYDQDDTLQYSVHIATKVLDDAGLQKRVFKGMPSRKNEKVIIGQGKDQDERQPIKKLVLPLGANTKADMVRYIVQLYMSFMDGAKNYAGTGTIIGIRNKRFFILTAAHNLVTYHVDEKIQADHVAFSFADDARKYPCPNYFVYPNYDCDEVDKTGKDIALLVSAVCNLGFPNTFPAPRCIPKGKYKNGYVIGYPGEEEKKGGLWGMQNALDVRENDKIRYAIDTTNGQSGSPILGLINGVWYIVGVHTDGFDDYNIGYKITQKVLNWIQKPSSFSTVDNTKNNLYLPYDLSYYKDRHLIKRETHAQHIEKTFGAFPSINKKSKIVILSAWGGAGKTMLAELYANITWQKKYQHIWRIHMESEETCKNSMLDICNTLGIQQEYAYRPNDQERYLFLKKMLEKHPKWLLILDNANQAKDIKEMANIHGGHILVTTRDANQHWQQQYPGSQRIHVEVLSPQESLALLFGFHKPTQDSEKESAQKLAKALGHLPLALAQAGYYIHAQKDQLGTTPYTIYLKEYQKQDKAFEKQHQQIMEETAPDNLKTTYNTFSITLNAIQADKSQYEALRILRVMAYFNPDGVDIVFFKHLRPSRKNYIIKQDKWWWIIDQGKTISLQEAQEAWQLLRHYGLVGEDQKRFKTHRLIQEIIRNRLNTNIAKHIQEQAVQLLETIHQLPKKEKRPANESSKKDNTASHQKALPRATQLNMLSHVHMVMHHVGHDDALRTRLLSLMNHLAHTDALQDNLYLPPQATNSKNLHTQVDAFVHTNKEKPLLLITGDAGAGKSAYATYLLQKTWEDYQSRLPLGLFRYKYLPIFISLPEICTDDKLAKLHQTFDLVAHALTKKGLTQTAIDNLQQKVREEKERLLLILDSFDEISTAINAGTKKSVLQI